MVATDSSHSERLETQTGTVQTLVMTAAEVGQRLDKYLADVLPAISRSRIQELIRDGRVTVDEQPITKPSYRLETQQVITIVIAALEPRPLEPEPIPLDIVYHDDQIAVVNKPAGMVVHPAAGHSRGTLANALVARFGQVALVGEQRRPGIVHRLDRDTSGLLVVALTEDARLQLKRQFQQRTVRKVYLALAQGVVSPPHGLIDAPIGRDPHRRQRMAVVPGGRAAITEYHTLEALGAYTLIQALPRTGRTHQIRVHFAFLGYPLAHDATYGRRSRSLPLDRHFLHAYQLTLTVPSTGEVQTFTAPIPPDLKTALNWLNSQWSPG
jgi:23S rRNA pseudouridine1911/1915/1917 synthase